MRRVAGLATFGLYDLMFEDKGARFVRMALEANSVLCRGGPQLSAEKSAMRIVAIATLHQPFIHAVMERPVELLADFQMATVAKLRSLLFHQMNSFFRMVRRMAIYAAHIVLQVS